ncbi:unnamed protein product [Brachionus calyciflorus]|uniref:non-specific serine/threonine protein kinase n=1 Tax=Brachionus calyciflorus TaxID=104777 RepID=A0A813W6G2_9BILA|nr:unnamed protein product [Brachionus calyciflorus]
MSDKAPRITVKPSLKQLDNGNKLEFNCEIEANPKPDIKWFKENVQINETERIKSRIESKGNNLYNIYLEIDNLTSDDSGQFKVTAKNRLGEVSAAIALNFAAETAQKSLQDGIAPNFTQKPAIKSDADGKRLCFECKIKAQPEPEIFWFRDNVPIANKGRYLFYCDKLPDDMYFACLEVDDVNMDDAGKYKVQAKNSLGESNASITLNFDSEDSGQASSPGGGKPVFVQKPFIRQLEDKIFFECKLTADPVPTFTWYLDNTVLNNPAKYKKRILSEGTTHTLILEINNLSARDSGDFKVVAKNRHGEADSNIKLNIESKRNAKLPDGIAPHFISKPLVNQTAEYLLIQLELEANPTPSASWYLDSKDLNDVDSRFVTKTEKISADKYLLSLEIKNPKNTDAGLYKCNVVNELGECVANIFLQFEGNQAGLNKGDQLPPSIIAKPKIIKDEAKRTVRIEVRIRAKPEAQITWLKEKTSLKNDKKYKIESKKESDNVYLLTLEISDFTSADGGLYKVQAKNESGQSNANIHLNVEVQEDKPVFLGQPRIIKENKNQRIVFEVDCGSKDKPQVTWTKDGKAIKNEGRYLIDIDDSQVNIFVIILEIDNIVAQDAGKYKCTAKNAKGENSIIIEFNLEPEEKKPEEKKVEEKKPEEKKVEEKKPEEKKPEEKKPEPKKPEEKKPEEKKPEEKKVEAKKSTTDVPAAFKEKPKDQVGLDGDRITVTCKVIGVPKPEITWYKNKQVIRKSKDLNMEFNGETAKLTINDAYTEDSGDYSCEVWNEISSQTSSFKITIKEKKGKPKRVRQKPKTEEPKTEEELRKEKRKSDAKKPSAEQQPAETQTPQPPQSNITPIYEEEGPKRPPKVPPPSSSDSNSSAPGSRKTSQPAIKLDVIDETGARVSHRKSSVIAPSVRKVMPKLEPHGENKAPVFIEKPENKVIMEGATDFIEAVVDGNPFPQVSWIRGNRDLFEGPKFEFECDKTTGVVGLTVKKAKSDDESKYTLRISNQFGEERATFSLFVKSTKDDAVDFRNLLKHREHAKNKLDAEGGEKVDLKHHGEKNDDEFEDDNGPKSSSSRRNSQIDARRPSMKHVEKPDNTLKVRRDSNSRRTSLAELIPDWPVLSKSKRTIKEPEKFVKTLQDKHAHEEDGSVSFECTFCKNNGKLRWYKNKQEIFHGFKYHVETEGANYRLVINKLNPEDEGKYICKVNEVETFAYLTVTPAKPKFEFLKKLPAKMEVFRTKHTVLECFVNHDECVPKWYKNGKLIKPDDKRYKTSQEKLSGRCTLRISKNIKDDEGEYSCVIDDGEKEVEKTSCYLYVEEPAFKFTKRLPQQVEANEYCNGELECEIEDPDAECDWYFEGKKIDPVEDADKYEIVINDTKRKLIVKKSNAKDRGRYECKCGVVTTGTELFVRPALKFVKELKDMEGVEEDTIELSVEVTKPDQKCRWIRNGRNINPNEERFAGRYVIISDGMNHKLTIKNVSLKDAGEFIVHVDELSSKCNLTIKECEKLPRVDLKAIPKVIKVKAGKDADIEIPFTSFPIPTVQWRKNGEPVDPKRGLSKHDDKKANLKIEKTQRGDSGKYELVLKNNKGEVVIPIELDVIDKPATPEGPLKIGDVTKETAILSWQPPKDDGGAPIEKYIIEKMDVARGEWSPAETVSGVVNQVKLTKLTPKKEYKFRVRAVNKEGESPNLETSTGTVAKNPFDEPSAPGSIDILDWDADRIELEWKAPENDGGAPIEKYLIEKREKGLKTPWVKAAEVNFPTTKTAVTGLSEGKEYEFRVIALNKAGPGEPSEVSRSQIAKPRFVAPRIDKLSLKPVTVKAGQTINVEANFIAEPQPTGAWSIEGKEIVQDDRTSFTLGAKNTKVVITNAKRSDTGKYTIKLTNSSGSDTASVEVCVLSAPGRPNGPIEVKDVKKDSATITWKKPDDDGGKEIGSYIVEKRDKKTDKWERVSDFVQGNSFTVPKLKEGHDYDFRVIAENQNGLSEPLETLSSTQAKNPFDAPGAPGKLECLSRSYNHIEIGWKKPSNDGGAPIKGYIVERREKDGKKWNRINKDLNKETSFFDDKVLSGKEYEYRVLAVNEGGEGEPSTSPLVVPAKPEKEKPKFDRSVLFGQTKEIRIKAGEPIDIELPIVGAPVPEVSWFKDNAPTPLHNNQNGVELASNEKSTKFYKPRAQRSDTGNYEVKLKNTEGEDVLPVKIIVLDKPAQCEGPLECVDSTKSSVTLQWKPPKDDGGSELSGYVIEKCPEGSDNWEKVPGIFIQPKATIKHLDEGKSFKFRVRAENIHGEGEPLETTKAIIVKPPYDPPSPPSQPEIADFNFNFIRLKWRQPEKDGGNPLTGYIVEMKEQNSDEWIQCNSFPVKLPEYTCSNVTEGNTYEFRVKGVNDAGAGLPSKSSKAQKAEAPITVAAQMDQPKVDGITKDSVSLSWKKPLDDGGSKITAIVVEKKNPDGQWEEVLEIPPKDNHVVLKEVKEGEECQFRIRAKNAAGLSNPSKPTDVITVQEQPAKPSFEITHVKDIVVKSGQNYEIHVPFKAYPLPNAEWTINDNEIKIESERIEIQTLENVACFVNHKAKRQDAGLYRLNLRNREGGASITLKVNVLDHPGKPGGPLEILNLDAESCVLAWKAPEDDGGNEITNYIVEKKEVGTDKWVKVSPNCLDNSCAVKGLEEGKEYEFRVTAENLHGLSDALTTPEPVTAKWPYNPPGSTGTPTCSDHTENSITLTWSKPRNDGGTPVTGYVVEKKEKGTDKWVPVSDRVTENEFTIKGLQNGKEYEFRVAASNKAGTGKWSNTEAPIEARPPDCAPKAFGFFNGSKDLVVKAGETLKITVPFQGSPRPTAIWSKVGEELKESERTKYSINQQEAELTTEKATLKDSGVYNCTLKNDFGQEKISIKVTVLDKPESPEGPLEVSEVKTDSVTLSWKPPKDNGGTPITNYVIEKFDTKKNEWQKVSSFCRAPQYEVIGLEEGRPYKFRVSAENAQGVSIPLETSTNVVPKNPFSLPDAPKELKLVNQSSETAVLTWEPPAQDGGAKITGYNLEMNECGSDDWFPVNDSLIRGTSFTVENLKPNIGYNFRIKAKNPVGWSAPSKQELTVVLKPEFVKPEAPGAPSVTKVGKKTAELTWTAPLKDGGAKINGYIVEKKQVNSDYWSRAHSYLISDTNCVVSELIDNADYEFRVRAVNKAGESEPSSTTGRVKITEFPDGTKPEFIKKLVDAEGSIGGQVSYRVEFEGKPAPTAKWFKNGIEVSQGNKYEIISEQFSSILTIKHLADNENNHPVKCVISNPLGKESSEALIKVIAIPKLEREPGDQTVGLDETLKVKIPIVGKGPFNVALKKDGEEVPADSADHYKVSELDGTVTFTIPSTQRDDTGKYEIAISNDSGTVTVPFKVKVKAPPGEPQGPLEVTDISKTSCTLLWKAPLDDGGNRVTHYIVEKRDCSKAKDNWIPYTDQCKDTFCTLQGLNENAEYEFRVLAVNQNGTSKPLVTTQSFVIKLPFGVPEAPSEPEINEIGNDFVTLTWNKPTSDNGGAITGYWVEKKDKQSDKWIKCNLNPIQTTSCNIPNLIENKEYEFRVFAENEAGLSKPSLGSKVVKIKDPHAAQIPEFSAKLRDTEAVEGKVAYFECQITGQPAPSVSFFRGSRELFESTKYKISQDGDKYILAIHNVTLDDEDEYSVKAKNKGGSRMSRANLTVKAAPKIKLPERYKTTVMFEKDEQVTIKIPFTGNPQPTATWFKGNDEIKDSSNYTCEISHHYVTLKLNKPSNSQSGDYKLKLTNSLGTDTCEIKIIIADVPEPPRFLIVESVHDESVSISWKAPENDGGSQITNYIVERLDYAYTIKLNEQEVKPITELWTRCSMTKRTHFTDETVRSMHKYQYRVIAQNLQGRSQPCEPTQVITTPAPENSNRAKKWYEDETGKRRRGKDGFAPSDYDKCVHDLWSRGQPEPADLKIGSVYDYYDIFEEIGSGAFGVVHRAVEKRTGRSFAAKFIPTPSPAEKSTVRKECDIMNQLIHPKLLNLHDIFDEADEMVLITEFLSGGELFEKIADPNYKMTEPEAKKYIRQILEGLQHMHDNNIVHLDIKPENIIFETKNSPNVKLVDFGLACKLDPDEIVKISSGTVEFAAPEIVEHDSVGFSTDMWAVGVLTYVILSGLSPFGGIDDEQTAENIKRCEIKFPSDAFGGISQNGIDFIQNLLVKNKAGRLNVYEALEHPWLNDSAENDRQIPSSKYDQIRSRIKDKYSTWPEPNPALGRMANFSSLRKLRPKEYKIYNSYFDRRDATPRFVIKPKNQQVKEGQNATFNCIILASSPPVVSWYQSGQEIKTTTKYWKRYNRNSYALEIRRCTLDDKGEYIVKAINSYGEREYNVFLNVEALPKHTLIETVRETRQKRVVQEMEFDLWKEPDEKATFTFKLRPRLIQVGINVKLLCCLAGKPTPKVQWFKNSTPISDKDHRYNIDHSAGVCTLEIPACSLSDAGTYFCRAENALGSDETSCHVQIEECKYNPPKALLKEQGLEAPSPRQSVVRGPKNEAPKFERKFPNHQLVSVGDIVSLRASYSGLPQPSIEWLKNGEPINSALIRTSDFDTCLTINSVVLGDEGEYSCKLTNSVGIEITKCQIEIEKPKTEVKKPIRTTTPREVKPKKLPTPEPIKEPSPQPQPQPEVPVVVEQPQQQQQEPEVVVKQPNQNKFGFLKHLKSQNLQEGEPLVLEAEVFGKEPLEFVWLRNGKEIPENPDFLKEKKDNLHRLIVSEIFPEDSGVFSLELFSELAQKSILSSCSVVVKAADEPELDPKFVEFPQSISVDEGSSVSLKCSLDGTKPISLKWFKNNELLTESNRVLIKSDEPNGNYELNIPTCLATDSGDYHATASNSNGEVIAAFSLIVSYDE